MPHDRSHGSPYDRGSADAYYRRPPIPHKLAPGAAGRQIIDLTLDEIEAYYAGYDGEQDRKDYE